MWYEKEGFEASVTNNEVFCDPAGDREEAFR